MKVGGMFVLISSLIGVSHGVADTTMITKDSTINAQMGLTLSPVNEPGDSVRWWPVRKRGWSRFQHARNALPPVRSRSAETYLDALAESVASILPEPRVRFHFHVADTLNASIWPTGGGFFVIHAGVFSALREEQFRFLLALELAHETLGHHPALNEGAWTTATRSAWPIEFWAMLIGEDPVFDSNFSYSVQQESDALEIVYRFYAANSWIGDFDELKRTMPEVLQKLDRVKGASSLPRLHKNLGFASRLPHDRPRTSIVAADLAVNPNLYQKAVAEMGRGDLQRYPWMLELYRYRSPWGKAAPPLYFPEKRKPELSERLAHLFAHGMHALKIRDWKKVEGIANQGLKLKSDSEPFAWLRLLALRNTGRFKLCASIGTTKWQAFDHRRELLVGQCLFLEGLYTDAATVLTYFRQRFPFDVEGAFWQALTDVRLRRLSADNLSAIESFWGARPYVRVLRALEYGYLGKPTEAHAFIDAKVDGLDYSDAERGALGFANSWLLETFSVHKEKDARAQSVLEQADKLWPIAKYLRLNFPREPLPKH